MSSPNSKAYLGTLLHFWNNGVRSPRELYLKTGIPLRTIKYNIKKLKETGNVERRKGGGRPKKITSRASKAIGQYVRRDPSISSRKIAIKLTEIDTYVSYRTVSRHLGYLGYKNDLPLATPMLTDKHKENRVKWAQAHLSDNWKKTFFSDETCFQLFRNTIKQWYKGARPTRRIPKDRTKICVWGGFCAKGKSNLFCFQEIMTGSYYVEILQKNLPEVPRMLGRVWRFQQDNDPKHTCKIATKYLETNVPEVIDWPSNSPDLNPIENLWGMVKRGVEKQQPKNLMELESFMVEEWVSIPDYVIKNLVGSMRRRCELIIEGGGERIPY